MTKRIDHLYYGRINPFTNKYEWFCSSSHNAVGNEPGSTSYVFNTWIEGIEMYSDIQLEYEDTWCEPTEQMLKEIDNEQQ